VIGYGRHLPVVVNQSPVRRVLLVELTAALVDKAIQVTLLLTYHEDGRAESIVGNRLGENVHRLTPRIDISAEGEDIGIPFPLLLWAVVEFASRIFPCPPRIDAPLCIGNMLLLEEIAKVIALGHFLMSDVPVEADARAAIALKRFRTLDILVIQLHDFLSAWLDFFMLVVQGQYMPSGPCPVKDAPPCVLASLEPPRLSPAL
jgi:hypothetical protein